ncbi:N-acyl amino acid synthase FeeM domain-containing protein [Nitrosospira briensis]|uniref:N-acyl amino acid synthase FeeM domain-containing protein n=1 Tax=Nitrosospira briensis TaxID=35799 RepID=UPI0008E6F641|nr:long-chain N-acyl amino acid synthase [Nitrosospira briensis]SFO22678.1 hypothetical protein SAMN05216332_10831 [Nitrosospira briensis]
MILIINLLIHSDINRGMVLALTPEKTIFRGDRQMNAFHENHLSLITRPIYMPQDDLAIVSVKTPQRLKNLSIAESNADTVYEHPIDSQVFHIRMVNSEGRREAASLLVKKRYSWRGYSVTPPSEKEPNRITLAADTGGRTVGTITLCLDGHMGLPADENFKDKLDELRAQGRRLLEPSRLALDDNVPQRVFASLIHISYIYAQHIFGLTDFLVEVNPRHVMFYKRMLGFKTFGKERACTRVNAPAVLLRLELGYMATKIEKFGGLMEKHGGERSLYPFFFPQKDELGIAGRLKTGRT